MMQRIWKAPTEVPLSEMRRRIIMDREKYAFYKDVEARLEQTLSAAIRYEFPDRETAVRYQLYATNKYRDRHGKGKMRAQVKVQDDGRAYVYFRLINTGKQK